MSPNAFKAWDGAKKGFGARFTGDILSELEAAGVQVTDSSISLPGLDWRNLVTAKTDTSLWWVSPSAQFRHELVVHHGPLHRPLFARLFKNQGV